MRILGIDPGSRATGYGMIDMKGRQLHCLDFGVIRLKQESFFDRIHELFQSVSMIIEEHQPDCAALEDVFVSKNPSSALKLGQARGAIIAACTNHHIKVSSYTPTTVKQSTVGYGLAEKSQVQHMVRTILSLDKNPPQDAADALAIAMCHSFHAPKAHLSSRIMA